MSIRRKVRSVEIIFKDLEKKIEIFKGETQLHCVTGCGFCCKKPDVEATVIEFLPLAFHYFQNNQVEEIYSSLKENPRSICVAFREGREKDAGFCTQYPYRGLICRLFGFSARKNKYGEPEYTTCKKIKETQSAKFIQTYLSVKAGAKIPFFGQYYLQLLKVDHEVAQTFYPINIAILKAIEMIWAYYSYRKISPKPKMYS